MAVPKRKTPRSKTRMRRAAFGVEAVLRAQDDVPDAGRAYGIVHDLIAAPGWSIVVNFHFYNSFLIFGLVMIHMVRVFVTGGGWIAPPSGRANRRRRRRFRTASSAHRAPDTGARRGRQGRALRCKPGSQLKSSGPSNRFGYLQFFTGQRPMPHAPIGQGLPATGEPSSELPSASSAKCNAR